MKNLLNKKTVPQDVDYTIVALDEDGKVTTKSGKPTPTYEFVDLGLPSGLKWATCNVGATKPEDYGRYFQWGDTVGYTDASHSTWATAPFNNGASSYNEAYFGSLKDDVCPNGKLASQYDAAYQATNGAMRMPTEDDFNELIDNTTSEWTKENGVNGRKYTSKTDSSKYIFIPAAGYASNSSVSEVGSRSNVWSSSLFTSDPSRALLLDFASGGDGMNEDIRYCGCSVRGVKE